MNLPLGLLRGVHAGLRLIINVDFSNYRAFQRGVLNGGKVFSASLLLSEKCPMRTRPDQKCGPLKLTLMQLCVLSLTLVQCSEFGDLFLNWSAPCKENHCPRNGDGSDYLTNIVPWTLTTDTIRQFDSGNGSPQCKTLHELVETITHPVANYTCQVPWMSNEEICSVLDQYSIVFWSGDSLMRHMTQALYILLRQDLQYGGYPTVPVAGEPVSHKSCSCDGQYSESTLCRTYKQEFSFTDMTSQLGVCPQLKDKFHKTEFVAEIESNKHSVPSSNMYIRPPALTCVNDSRPFFFFIEGTRDIICLDSLHFPFCCS